MAVLNLGNTRAVVKLTARNNELVKCWRQRKEFSSSLMASIYTEDVFAELGVENNFGPLEIESPNLQPLIGVTLIGSASHTSGFLEAVPSSNGTPEFPALARIQ